MKKKIVLAVATVVALATVAVAAFGSAAHMSTTDLQADIKKVMTERIQSKPGGKTVTVKTIKCLSRTETSARCVAKLHDSAADGPMTDTVNVKVTFDDDGSYTASWVTEL